LFTRPKAVFQAVAVGHRGPHALLMLRGLVASGFLESRCLEFLYFYADSRTHSLEKGTLLR